MKNFNKDLLTLLQAIRYKYEALYIHKDPKNDPDFPYLKIGLTEEEIMLLDIPLISIFILHTSINNLLNIPKEAVLEWRDLIDLDEEKLEPTWRIIPKNYLWFTITHDIHNIIKKLETGIPFKTYYDDNGILMINGRAHVVSRKSQPSNAHYIFKYIFNHEPKEEHFYSELEEQNIFYDHKEWDTYYKALNTVKERLDNELGIKDFFEKISTGKTGSVKINSKYL